MTRVAVFMDYQNVYHGARECFHGSAGYFTEGQVYPRRVGVMLTDKGRSIDPSRELEYVKVFRGEPSPVHSAKAQAACQRQVRFWNVQQRVEAITRPLKYRPTGTDYSGRTTFDIQEKGIDVLVALHMVMGAMRDEYDVAVLFSADSDLAPAVEAVSDLKKKVEVVGWKSRSTRRQRIGLPGRNIWCHWLDATDYGRLADATDYTVDQGTPTSNP